MIEMTDAARKELEEYFKDKERGDIRIYLAPGGCSGPRLALALDNPTDDDDVQEVGGFKFCISKKLEGDTGNISIDLTDMGFNVVPEKELPMPEGGGCGGCCGGCGGH